MDASPPPQSPEMEQPAESPLDQPMKMTEDTEVSSPSISDSPLHDPLSPASPDEPDSFLDSPPEDAKIRCTNPQESKMSAILHSRNLWKRFDTIGTEMIVTRRGRRMFPSIKVELFDLDPDTYYVLLMDMAPVDKYRYKYQNSAWVKCFEEECSPTRLYIHPDSPALGSHWTKMIINFYKLKLTNNQLDKQGHIIVNSMHRYQPRLHVAESRDVNNLNWENFHTFIFPGTQFTTVTAYQNDKITQLKIENNPFAKGFRSPFSRCRTRNQTHRLSMGSCSDSGPDDVKSPPTVVSPHVLLQANHHRVEQVLRGVKRKSEGSDDDNRIYKRIFVAPPVADGLTRVATPQMIANSGAHTQVISSAGTLNGVTLTPSVSTPNGTTPVYIVYKPMVQPAGNESARLSPIAKDATVAQSVIQTGINGATLIQASSGHPILNGTTIIQAQPFASNDPRTDVISQQNVRVVRSPKLNGTTLPGNATILQAANHPAFINGINGTTIIQANGQQVQLVQPQALVNGLSTVQTVASPSQVVTTTSNSKNRDVLPVAKTRPTTAPTVDIRSLTRENPVVKPPPPALVRVRLPDKEDSVNERVTISPPSVVQLSNRLSKINGQNVIFQSPMPHGGDSIQKVYIVAENAVDPSTMILPAQNAADINHLRPQTVVPIGYEQQVVTPMPIYRFNTNTIQPIQILRTIPAGPNPATMTTA